MAILLGLPLINKTMQITCISTRVLFFNFVFSLIYLDMVNLEYGYSNTCIDDININNKGVLSLSLNIKIRIHGISDSGKLCR